MKVNGLTESEKITMKCVWDLGEGARLAHIMEVANSRYKKNWKPQTVSTFLGKLVRKGFLEQYRDGRYFYYHILVSRHDYRCRMLRDDLDFWDDGDVDEFVSELMDKKTFSIAQRTEILKMVSKKY
ncbi:MAG: BlaI/MecI/CopY family transcriptional regulator [Lachnospiraceae bacterium]|jgi:Predicted transcriptional regulator|nr:BlaI/MecI/CopY family transcriptional regulator [Lachnospiraceae bacterium]